MTKRDELLPLQRENLLLFVLFRLGHMHWQQTPHSTCCPWQAIARGQAEASSTEEPLW